MAQTISTVVGCGIGDDSIATKAELFMPGSMAIDSDGNMYISDGLNYKIRKVQAGSHVITTIAGNGVYADSGDGGSAITAQISGGKIVLDKAGNLYIGEQYRIRRINNLGIITTIAGTGIAGFSGDNGPATDATFMGISDIAVDTFGDIYVADFLSDRVRKINSLGVITTVAGNGSVGYSADGTLATGASLNRPFSVATDNVGNFYLGEYNNHYIRKVDTAGILSTIAGNGTRGYTGDGGPATAAEMTAPVAIILDSAGNIYFSDNHNYCVRKVDLTGVIITIGGNGISGFIGDAGAATSAEMCTPNGLVADKFGNVYVGDAWNNRVRVITPTGTISTYAGQSGLFDESIQGVTAEISVINNMAADTSGRLYFADTYNNRIRRLDPATGLVTTVAGDGIAGYADGYSGDGGPATSAHIYYPYAVTTDKSGNIFIADSYNNRVRKVVDDGTITTIAGKGIPGFGGDGGIADSAMLSNPNNVAVDGNGNVYIGDENNYRIRKVNTSGVISTIAGTGTLGFSGDGGPATAATLGIINDLFTDKNGNLFIADAYNQRMRKIDTFGMITTIAGNGTNSFTGDGGPATNASLSEPCGIKIDDAGNIYIADFGNGRVRKIDPTGTITTVAGNGGTGFGGDGGPALLATFNGPAQLALGKNGELYISDDHNFRIRKVEDIASVQQINRTTRGNVSIVPNPVKEQVTLSVNIENFVSGNLSIYASDGHLVLSERITMQRQELNVGHLIPGFYDVEVILNNGQRIWTKMIKD